MNSGTIKSSAPSAEMQIGSFRVGDLAAGRGHDRMAGRDVPFAGRGEARVDIGAAFRHAAEFDRRAERLADRAGPAVDEGFGPGIAVRTADGDDPGVAALRECGGYGSARPPAPTHRLVVSRSAPRPTRPRHISPSAGAPMMPSSGVPFGHQREIDGELVAAGDEFLGAVQRIDQEEAAVDNGGFASGTRSSDSAGTSGTSRARPSRDDPVGGQIRLRHRRSVGLAVDLHGVAVDGQNGGAGLASPDRSGAPSARPRHRDRSRILTNVLHSLTGLICSWPLSTRFRPNKHAHRARPRKTGLHLRRPVLAARASAVYQTSEHA